MLYSTSGYPIQVIGAGYDGLVARVSMDHVAKVFFNNRRGKRSSKDSARWEFDIAEKLFGNGISVPEPLGVFLFSELTKNILHDNDPFKGNFRRKLPENPAGYIMHHIPGAVDLCKVNFASTEEKKSYYALYEEEIEKARELGFVPNDCGPSNMIYQQDEGKVYLIDFAAWLIS